MSPELIAIFAVGVALGGLLLQGQRGLGKRIDGLEQRMDKRIDSLEQRMDRRIDGLEQRMDDLDARLREVENGLAELRGQLTLIRDYILRQNTPAEEPAE